MRRICAALLVAAVLSSFTACAAATVGTTDDATISTRVKIALLDDPATQLLRLDVRTFQGVVTLSGSVPSGMIEQRAVTVAKTISGVKGVKNQMTVGSMYDDQRPDTRHCAC